MQQAAARGIALTITGGLMDIIDRYRTRNALFAAFDLRRPNEIGYADAIVSAIDAHIDQRIADKFADHFAVHERAEPVPVVGANREHRRAYRAPSLDAIRDAINAQLGHYVFSDRIITRCAAAIAKLYDDANA